MPCGAAALRLVSKRSALQITRIATGPCHGTSLLVGRSADMSAPKGPYKLVTVNTAPERAKRVIGKVVEDLKERYTIQHVANCQAINEVASTVKELEPDLLFCASMWTPEESDQIQKIARDNIPSIITHAIPQGLQVERGPDAVVEYLEEQIPKMLG